MEREEAVKRIGELIGKDDGRFLRLPLTSDTDKTILKDVNKIEGDASSVLITYVDTSTETVTP